MKTSKFNSGLLALVLGVTIAFTGSAFTAKRELTQWHFKSTSNLADAKIAEAYELATEEESCNEMDVEPCIIQAEAADYTELQTYLDGFVDDNAVKNSAVSTRN